MRKDEMTFQQVKPDEPWLLDQKIPVSNGDVVAAATMRSRE